MVESIKYWNRRGEIMDLKIYFSPKGEIVIPYEQWTDWEIKDGFVMIYNGNYATAAYNADFVISVISVTNEEKEK